MIPWVLPVGWKTILWGLVIAAGVKRYVDPKVGWFIPTKMASDHQRIYRWTPPIRSDWKTNPLRSDRSNLILFCASKQDVRRQIIHFWGMLTKSPFPEKITLICRATSVPWRLEASMSLIWQRDKKIQGTSMAVSKMLGIFWGSDAAFEICTRIFVGRPLWTCAFAVGMIAALPFKTSFGCFFEEDP